MKKQVGEPPSAHQAHVLRLLRDEGPIPRVALTRRTGLSATTITKIVAQLLEEGYASQGHATSETGLGRPAVELSLVPDSAFVVGVQVGVGFVQIGLCDLRAQVRHSDGFQFDLDEPPDSLIERIGEHVARLMRVSAVDRNRVLGVGIAAPGPVDVDQRRNLVSLNLGWHDVDFASGLERLLDIPVVVDHNVRAMALAEARYGLGGEVNWLAYVYIRTGVGAGLVVEGRPFRSGGHGIVELGHLRVADDGPQCVCGGTGCLETFASETSLTRRARSAIDADPDGPLAVALRDETTLLSAVEVAAGYDPSAKAILDDTVRHLVAGLSNLAHLITPELIVLGGIFVNASDALMDQIRTDLRAAVFQLLRDEIRVERSTLGLDAGVAGAAALALDKYLYVADEAFPGGPVGGRQET